MNMIKLMKIMLVLPLALLANTVSQAGKIWYVNARSGSDFNSGFSSWAAKATIQAAVDVAIAGDIIRVSSGTYSPIVTNNKLLTIIGDGSTSTIIDGNRSRRCITVKPDGADSGIYTNTVVMGFTLQNGWVANASDSNNGGGGCVKGGRLVRCIVTGGEARGGGGGSETLFESCLIRDNYAQYNGGGGDGCVFRNCTLVNNRANHNGAAYCASALENCIVYGNRGITEEFSGRNLGWTNPLVEAWDFCRVNVCSSNPGFVNVANGDYRLAAGSPCIDAGDNSYVTTPSDLLGNNRIANGTVDIGCYEY